MVGNFSAKFENIISSHKLEMAFSMNSIGEVSLIVGEMDGENH